MNKRRTKVRKHRRRLKSGGRTIVNRHFRRLNSSDRWRKDKTPLKIERLTPGTSKALAKVDSIPAEYVKERKKHFQIINPNNKIVTYQNQEIINIPLENKKLLDLKLKLWSDLNSDFPLILQLNPVPELEGYFYDVLELSDKQYFDSLIEIIKQEDRPPILNEVNYVLSDLIRNDRLYREEAEKIRDINNQKLNAIRETSLRGYSEKWAKWKDYPAYLETL